MKTKDITIGICGTGYVGFPVAMLFAEKGFKVIGFDVDLDRVKMMNEGKCPVGGEEPGLLELVQNVNKKGTFKATTDVSKYSECDYIIIAVQTPVENDTKAPKYKSLRMALDSIGKNMKKGAIVIVESTIAPNTMRDVVQPILEAESGMKAGIDFGIANCPERLMPGHLIENITNYNRVLGGIDSNTTKKVKDLYSHIVKGDIDEVSMITAEIVKTGENTYRDVQIAFANELALLCEVMGANVWEVRELINKCKKITDTRPEALRQVHFPGAGVGGHCIPKDSWLLVNGAKGKFKAKIIPDAREINDYMPIHMYELFKSAVKEVGKNPNKVNVVILGYAYNGNSDDDRNTPTESLMNKLDKEGIKYVVHDSYVNKYKGNLKEILKDKDGIILMTAHDEYKEIDLIELKKILKNSPFIVDGRNVFNKEDTRNKGFVYKGVGNV